MGIVILEPPQITKSFGAATIPVNGTTTVNFSINNPNVVAINASFTDTLPVGLQVAATPGVTNTCGGTVTAVAGSGSISFSNNLTPVGVCTISVNITGTVDNNYTNSVQILSTDAGNGNTSSANITVINPPTYRQGIWRGNDSAERHHQPDLHPEQHQPKPDPERRCVY